MVNHNNNKAANKETGRMKEAMEARARQMVKDAAIGATQTIKLKGNRRITGTVVEVTFNRIKRMRNGDLRAVFNMTVECGTARIRHTVAVYGFPGR